MGYQRLQVPSGLPGERGSCTPHPHPHPSARTPGYLSPGASPAGKDPLPPGVFLLPLSNRKRGPRKDWRALPFDPQEPEARPSWQLLFPDTEQSPGSPRLPGTSREIVWSRGLLSVPISPPDCLESGSGQRIRPGTGKPQEQGLEHLKGDVGGGWRGGLGPAHSPSVGHCYFQRKSPRGHGPQKH